MTLPEGASPTEASSSRTTAAVSRPSRLDELLVRVQPFLARHGRKLWWLHSTYALALGAFVVLFAQKGFHRARWLAVSLVAVWLVVVLFFRWFGSGAAQQHFAAPRSRLRFLVMTYALKNLYQGMLFFLLPFYWKSTTFGAPNCWFVVLLAACAVLSTVDLVFDHVLMRWRAVASAFYAVTLFACLNLLIPAVLPNTRTLWTLLSAAAVAVAGFWTVHVPPERLRRRRTLPVFAGTLVAAVAGAYFARAAVPPVPMYLSHAAVGPAVLPDGRLAMEVYALHTSAITQLLAVTDVMTPGGKGDRLHHVWRLGGREVSRSPEETSRVAGPRGTVRLRSALEGAELPARLAGDWAVDVETEDGQLVGRISFVVTR